MKKTFNAVATREGKWWVVDVDGVGTTQGRTVREAEEMATDLIVAMRRVSPELFQVSIEFRLLGEDGEKVVEARLAQQAAIAAQKGAAAKIRAVLGAMLAAGLSKRDAAHVLGVSPQRVSQLSATGKVEIDKTHQDAEAPAPAGAGERGRTKATTKRPRGLKRS